MVDLTATEYRLLVEHAPMMIWRSGLDGRCDYFNETWLRFTGRSLAQELGDGWAEAVHPEDLERCLEIQGRSFSTRTPFEMEYRLRRHDGHYRHVLDRGVPFETDGAFAGFIGSCVDVHDRREAEASKTRSLAMVAHELRTPMQSMMSYLDIIAHRLQGGPVSPSLLHKLRRQVDRTVSVLRDLDDASTLERQAPLTLQRAPANLERLVRDLTSALEPVLAMKSSKHDLQVQIEPGSYDLVADPERLHQALANLVDNAVKYSPSGGAIVVGLRETPSTYRLSVRDRGIGIPPAERARVTQRFHRASNAQPSHFSGLGLGLAITREIVELHGGSLSFESNLGEGTEAIVELSRSGRSS